MNIVEPTADDMTLQEAIQIVGCSSAKTLRRAVKAGDLPRRYIMTAHGPQLVFLRADLERWMAQRKRSPRGRKAAATAPAASVQTVLLGTVRRLLDEASSLHAAVETLAARLEQQDSQLANARGALDRLAALLTDTPGLPRPKREETAGDTEARRVLVVDDDEDILAVIKEALEIAGYVPDLATNGEAAHLAAHTRPALVLLDLMMPGVDGYEVGRRLRADPRTADVPIVVMSAGARASHGARDIGANGYLAKPFALADLVATVGAFAGQVAC
jgi:CheY-like chemotaxis protein